MQKKKLLYVSTEDPLDRKSWSGIHFHMHAQLCRYFEVTHTGPLKMGYRCFISKLINKVCFKIFKIRYNFDHSAIIGRFYAKSIRSFVKDDIDVVFCTSSREIACMQTDKPIVYATDGTFNLVHNYYSAYSLLFSASVRESNQVEKKALESSAIALFSSQWAASSAKEYYLADPNKVKVIPFGSNLEDSGWQVVKKRSKITSFHILFIGVDWKRKGGDRVYDTCLAIFKKGYNVKLTIIGCRPPFSIEESWIELIPNLDKSVVADRERLHSIFISAHLFFLPTLADCTPIVFCEAAAFALPIVTTNTGGVGQLVRQNINGFCLSPSDPTSVYVACIENIMKDSELYARLSENSRRLYEEELNWDVWGRKLKEFIDDLLKSNTNRKSVSEKVI